MSQFEYLLSRQELFRRRRPGRATPRASTRYDRRSEWSARPLGRLGRPLLEEIERYVEFYSIARS